MTPSLLASTHAWQALLYSADPTSISISVPDAATDSAATCGGAAISPRYKYFILACDANATECSDDKIDCPTPMPGAERWAGAARGG